MYRFYLPTLSSSPPDQLCLPDDQLHHALSVLRLQAGEPVILFDGQGQHAPAVIAAASKKSLSLKLTGPIRTDPPPSPALTIATAVPKADRADWLIEQASQLNVTRIQWLDTDRSVVKPKEGSAKLDKHNRLAIESAKQCHRTHLLEVAAPLPLAILLKNHSQKFAQILWLDPSPESQPIHHSPLPVHHSVLALIGPEGGWSPREHELLNDLARRNQLARIRLTPTILRIETACTALAANIMCSESSG